jgi:hypothetical protein
VSRTGLEDGILVKILRVLACALGWSDSCPRGIDPLVVEMGAARHLQDLGTIRRLDVTQTLSLPLSLRLVRLLLQCLDLGLTDIFRRQECATGHKRVQARG